MLTMAAHVLVAAYPDARERLTDVLSGHHLTFANTLGEAREALARKFDMIIIGTRFDESRMLDLLRHLHALEKTNHIPIVCFRGMLSVPVTDPAIAEGLSLACEVLGARAFYDFASYPNDQIGNAAVRRILESHLPA